MIVTPAEAQESRAIFLFVVLPLIALIAAGLLIMIWRGSGNVAKFPTFSVRIERFSREDSYIIYRDGSRRLYFNAGPCERDYVCLKAIWRHPVEDIGSVVPNLISGLARLGFKQYAIYSEEGQILARFEQNGGDGKQS
jgi:hypothetical protein